MSDKKSLFQFEVDQISDYQKIIHAMKAFLSVKTCVLLHGDLAAGKTTFVQEFCRSFAIENVSSPTFSIHQSYKNTQIQIDHFDLYRLENAEDIETSGLWDVFAKDRGLIFIEWPSRIEIQDLPLDWKLFDVQFQVVSGEKRIVTVNLLN
ncbi:MAG: tRNA (adenosine(37)-N6)-threonylcarbamoyltransferase complex ATPase subunit type 1 TsaE [Bdellovibrionales bacterium RIFCSPHIGHO2_01_FULL_40_29]|nr:MAG: tRNA (adenosine(37)-N6)-threonylcarbamoyltransferase complex ATPase subunit type 1 TsaE [Bdellovibrionales bacterium RIFCSPHIGHO2_01_FULL_40_29]OFZ34378.1 MAG: tRNA (adenosine(37)-N6)-threonylcarbamoyltransferase complex ATPase subunit type 1 TsaE [Bdellovibrionales bacterium RIFCSPHIGHO2_02_FULL_40_15]